MYFVLRTPCFLSLLISPRFSLPLLLRYLGFRLPKNFRNTKNYEWLVLLRSNLLRIPHATTLELATRPSLIILSTPCRPYRPPQRPIPLYIDKLPVSYLLVSFLCGGFLPVCFTPPRHSPGTQAR